LFIKSIIALRQCRELAFCKLLSNACSGRSRRAICFLNVNAITYNTDFTALPSQYGIFTKFQPYSWVGAYKFAGILWWRIQFVKSSYSPAAMPGTDI
jgi:hypothetical protein